MIVDTNTSSHGNLSDLSCADTDGGALSSAGFSCDDASTHAAAGWSEWTGRPRTGYNGWIAYSWCGSDDDDDFTAEDMCCACRGGQLMANGSKTRAVWAAFPWSEEYNARKLGLTAGMGYPMNHARASMYNRYNDPTGLYGDACYSLVSGSYSERQFHSCSSMCRDVDGFGSPASVRNKKHWNWLKQNVFLHEYEGRMRYDGYWLGLTDILVEGTWQWMNGWGWPDMNDNGDGFDVWIGTSPDDHYYAEDCVYVQEQYLTDLKEGGGTAEYGWSDVSCSKEHRSSKGGRNIREERTQHCLCEWPAVLAPEYAELTKDDWNQMYPHDGYLMRAVLAGIFGYIYILAVFYFVFLSAKSLIRKQLHVSDRAARRHAAKRAKRPDVSAADVTVDDWNGEFLELVRQAQTPNPLTAGVAELQ